MRRKNSVGDIQSRKEDAGVAIEIYQGRAAVSASAHHVEAVEVVLNPSRRISRSEKLVAGNNWSRMRVALFRLIL